MLGAQGSFTLHLRGLLPSVNLGLPVHIDYKYCPVKDVTTKTFDIHNDQNFIVGFKWLSVTHPFSITPLQGNLKPGQTATISCHFCPDDATAYKGVVRMLLFCLLDHKSQESHPSNETSHSNSFIGITHNILSSTSAHIPPWHET